MQCNGIAVSQGALLTSGYGLGVFRSTDLGESWTQITEGFDGFLFVGGFYTSGDIAVVGGSRGTMRTTRRITNGGEGRMPIHPTESVINRCVGPANALWHMRFY